MSPWHSTSPAAAVYAGCMLHVYSCSTQEVCRLGHHIAVPVIMRNRNAAPHHVDFLGLGGNVVHSAVFMRTHPLHHCHNCLSGVCYPGVCIMFHQFVTACALDGRC